MAKSAAWQRKEGKNPKGGLNAKGRASYKKQTGGTLKAPSKKVGNKRRASFCARMSGMKKKLTSAKTARDPNSRMRDNKSIETYLKEKLKRIKEMSLFRNLKKEVETGANGTQEYVIKQGPNKDKIAK